MTEADILETLEVAFRTLEAEDGRLTREQVELVRSTIESALLARTRAGRLADMDRKVLHLQRVGIPVPAIAERLGMGRSTAYRAVKRALKSRQVA